MAASALEEKINKIKQQNEEIRRRYEEVEEDKKNAAKLNALVQMVPSTDWPERKEPPEFFNPSRAITKSKPAKEHHESPQQYHAGSGEGRKVHAFAQGQGPPPDPKYNFLADSEREESNMENIKDNPPNRGQKHSRDIFGRKLGGKDGMQRDYRPIRGSGSHRDEHQPEYEAWRAERNRIDEDRISRQRTAEGNWRREWDNDKAHIMNETRSEAKLGNYMKKNYKDYDREYHVNGNDYAHHNRGGNHRSYRGNSKHFHSNYENRSNNAYYQDGHAKNPLSPGSEGRTVIATDKGIKVTLNQGNTKSLVTSVKVNSPSIAGTGRVGPRQRSRVTYSSHSDVETTSGEIDSLSRPKFFENKTKGIYHDNRQRSPNARKTQPLQRRKNLGNKSPYFRKKEIGRKDSNENVQKQHEVELRSSHVSEEYKNSSEFTVKPEQFEENNVESPQNDHANVEEGDLIASSEPDAQARELNNCDNQNDDSSIQVSVSETHAKMESESTLTNLKAMPAFQVKTEIEVPVADMAENESNETEIVKVVASSEYKAAKTDSTTAVKDAHDNGKNETELMTDMPCDINNDKEIVEKNKEQNSSTEQTEEITSDNCDNERNENVNEQENDGKSDTKDSLDEKEADNAISSSLIDECPVTEFPVMEENTEVPVMEENTEVPLMKENMEVSVIEEKPKKEDGVLKKGDIVVADGIIATAGKINTNDQQDTVKACINETQEHTVVNNDEEKKNKAMDDVVPVGKVESSEGDLQAGKEKVISDQVVEIEKL